MCDKIVTPSFHFDHLPTQMPKSAHCAPDSESEKKYLHIFVAVRLPQTWLSKKQKQLKVFCSSWFWKLNFGISKVHFLVRFWSFRDMIWKDVSFFLLTTNLNFICGQASMLNLDIKINVSFKSQNVNKWILPLHEFL